MEEAARQEILSSWWFFCLNHKLAVNKLVEVGQCTFQAGWDSPGTPERVVLLPSVFQGHSFVTWKQSLTAFKSMDWGLLVWSNPCL